MYTDVCIHIYTYTYKYKPEPPSGWRPLTRRRSRGYREEEEPELSEARSEGKSEELLLIGSDRGVRELTSVNYH